jgi:hypothetical protein
MDAICYKPKEGTYIARNQSHGSRDNIESSISPVEREGGRLQKEEDARGRGREKVGGEEGEKYLHKCILLYLSYRIYQCNEPCVPTTN